MYGQLNASKWKKIHFIHQIHQPRFSVAEPDQDAHARIDFEEIEKIDTTEGTGRGRQATMEVWIKPEEASDGTSATLSHKGKESTVKDGMCTQTGTKSIIKPITWTIDNSGSNARTETGYKLLTFHLLPQKASRTFKKDYGKPDKPIEVGSALFKMPQCMGGKQIQPGEEEVELHSLSFIFVSFGLGNKNWNN
jgi:hypothetical protein